MYSMESMTAPSVQAPREVLMIRPKHFDFDPTTAASNKFQRVSHKTKEEIKEIILSEFDSVVSSLTSAGVRVKVFEDREVPVCPDAIFPNNWISMHQNGLVVLYPMCAVSRRDEQRWDIVDYLKETGQVDRVLDMSSEAEKELYLEGTGSIVLDHINKRAFTCRSSRTDVGLLMKVCLHFGYEYTHFEATDHSGVPIYHTNVMMWIGTDVAAVCLDTINDEQDRQRVSRLLAQGGRAVIDLSYEEMLAFCGNCLEVTNDENERLLAISQQAYDGLSCSHKSILEKYFDAMVVCDVKNIEHVGGGGIRCMMAGNHLLSR